MFNAMFFIKKQFLYTMRKTIRKQGKRRRTRRGGAVSELETILSSVVMKPTFVNPSSKFVVVTYWWGRGNLNRNTQRPCPEDITDALKEGMEEELIEEDEEYADLQKRFIGARDAVRSAGKNMTRAQSDLFRTLRNDRVKYLVNYFKRPDIVDAIRNAVKPYEQKLRTAGKFKDPIRFETMIANWENACRAANCNFMAVECPQFTKPGGYQLAINAKPLFIRKALRVLQGRSALYIDGDMLINKYPAIFDIQNVDFMARGWNADPRSSAEKYKESVCFDPYIFETSGGTMFFANTPAAMTLLVDWQKESDKPINAGKADDRILSLVFTARRYIPHTNTIQLPIEYLWLGEIYNGVIDKNDMDQKDIYIEHPECLTGEERAGELSLETVSNSREPKFYGRLVESQVECARRGGVFYERVFFPTKDMVSSFAPYLRYMKNARHHQTKKPMFEVIDFEDGYGRYNSTVLKNREAAKGVQVLIEAPTQASLPIGTPIPVILAHLMKGVNVKVGAVGQVPPNTECMSTNIEGEGDVYTQRIRIDTTKPIFFSAKNIILTQLVSMCATLEDMNKHLEESYVFMSRIRWSFSK
jgi:hypothetical protein